MSKYPMSNVPSVQELADCGPGTSAPIIAKVNRTTQCYSVPTYRSTTKLAVE